MRQQNSNGGRRPRGRTNNRKQHGGGQHRSGTYDSNGPDGRIRGNANQVYEKYVALARDATSAGDRIAAESYYQHAEHYFRIVNDSTDPESPGSQRAPTNQSQPGTAPQGMQDGQTGQAPRPNGEIEFGQMNQGNPNQGRHNGRDHSGRQGRGGQNERGGYQDRHSRMALKNDADVPGFEPQPDLSQTRESAPAGEGAQNELPLSGDSRQQKSPGEAASQAVPRSGNGSGNLESAVSESEQVEVTPANGSGQAADSIAVEKGKADASATETTESPAPRRRGRPRKRPLGGDQDAASDNQSADSEAAVAEATPAPAKRRGRPRKTAEPASSADKDDASEGPNAANA